MPKSADLLQRMATYGTMKTPTRAEYEDACKRGVTLLRTACLRAPGEQSDDMHRQLFLLERVRRVHILRTLRHEFGFRTENVLECGAAGNVTVPMAYVDARCIALDMSLGVFANETNYFDDLPVGSFATGISTAGKRAIDERLSNHHRIVGDAKAIPLNNDSIDTVIVFNEPFLFKKAAPEATRVLKAGGYLINIIDNLKQSDKRSFYTARSYRTKNKCDAFSPTNGLRGMMKIELPPWLRAYEFSPYTDIDRTRWYTGDLFEVFMKPGQAAATDHKTL